MQFGAVGQPAIKARYASGANSGPGMKVDRFDVSHITRNRHGSGTFGIDSMTFRGVELKLRKSFGSR
jgi:hypothetical protein